MSILQQVAEAQANPEVVLNENFVSLEHQAVYAMNPDTTSGLTWGYYGGRWGGFAITAGPLSLTASQTNYVVVAIATGVISVATASTNWDNDTDYVRVYKLTTSASAVTATEDHRAGPGGVHGGAGGGGGGSGTVTSVAVSVPSHLSVTGSPVTTSGTIAIAYSGTALPIANGGTGGTSASGARTALGLAIGTDVQAHNARLADIAGITYAQGDILYHNGTNLVKLAAGTSGHYLKTNGTGANPQWAAVAGGGGGTIGKHLIPINAAAMVPATITPCGTLAQASPGTDKPDYLYLPFDSSSLECAVFSIEMPESWDEGTLTFIPVWSHGATTTNFGVVWRLECVAVSNDDTLNTNFGTQVTSTDTGGTTDDLYKGPESAVMTPGGSPAAGDTVYFRIARVPSDAADTLAVDARLHGIRLYYTTAAETD